MNRNNVKRIAAMICAGLIAFAFVVSMVMPIVNAAPSKEDVNNAKQNTQNAKNDVKAAEEKLQDSEA